MESSAGVPAHKPRRGILPGVQLLRGWAAILVVVSHANGMMGDAEFFGRHPFDIGGSLGVFGVAVFFVISGFIIAIVALDEKGQPVMSLTEYAKRRFIRIVPFMWLCAIGYNVFTYLGTGVVEWGPALRGLVVWPVGELKPNVLWSLRHEFLFYLLFGLTMMLSRKRLWLLMLWFVAPVLIYGALLPFDPLSTPWHPYHNELVRVVFLGSDSGANLQLGAGFLMGIAWLRGAPAMRDWLSRGLIVSTVLVVLGALIMIWAPHPPGLLRTLLWTALGGAIVYSGIVARASPGLLQQTGLLLGNASFSIYLVHNPILLILLVASSGMTALLPPAVWMVMFVVVATAGGIAVHFLVERPLISWLSHGRKAAPWMLLRRSARP